MDGERWEVDAAPARSRYLGGTSLAAGSVAIVLAMLAVHLRREMGLGSSAVLDWLLGAGVQHRGTGYTYAGNPGLFSITDSRALGLLSALAVGLALVGMVVALVAEYRREPTLLLSAGYVLGSLALFVFRPAYGMAALIAGIAVAMVLRHGRGEGRDI